MDHLLEIREELGLGDLFPPDDVVKEVQTIFEETGFKERLRAVRGEVSRRPARAEPTIRDDKSGLPQRSLR